MSGGFTMKATAAALLVVTSMTAQAAEPETLTLACQGTVTITPQTDAKPEPISMGIIVTTEGAVGGFTNLAHINRFKATTIEFLGNIDGWWVEGSIDRVTGDVSATERLSDQGRLLLKKEYSLKCSPAQRKF